MGHRRLGARLLEPAGRARLGRHALWVRSLLFIHDRGIYGNLIAREPFALLCARGRVWRGLRTRADAGGASVALEAGAISRGVVMPPNKRLKLAAPLLNESGERSACGVVEFRL